MQFEEHMWTPSINDVSAKNSPENISSQRITNADIGFFVSNVACVRSGEAPPSVRP